MPNKAVFLDRDGTVIENPGYLADPGQVRLLPGAATALRRLTEAGFKLVLVTNQSGIARGLLTEQTLHEIHRELRRLLAAKGARLDGIFYCPYHPEGTVTRYAVDSDLRKPAPGMLMAAARELDLDLAASWIVGDSERDTEAGRRAGCRSILLRTSTPASPGAPAEGPAPADFVAADLAEAAEIILRHA